MAKTRPSDVILATLFVVVLFLPLLDKAFGLDHAPRAMEKRALARRPGLDLLQRDAPRFFREFQDYWADHFGFRLRLIRWFNKINVKVLGKPPTGQVVMGKDGWLFYQRAVEYTIAYEPFTEAQLESWRRLLEGRRDALAARGIRYLFFFAPNAETIHPEGLPDWVDAGGRPTRLDQLAAYLREKSDLELLDLRPVLKEKKAWRPMYPKTDSHWTDDGAFVVYQAVMGRLGGWFPGLRADPPEAFRREVQAEREGDLSALMGSGQLPVEPRAVYSRARPVELELFTDFEYVGKKWVTNQAPRATENPGSRVRAVFFGDSFGPVLQPFLAPHFRRFTLVWQDALDEKIIGREKSDVVIQEMAERFLKFTDPEAIRAEDSILG